MRQTSVSLSAIFSLPSRKTNPFCRVNLNISTLILGVRDVQKGELARGDILAQASRKSAVDVQVWPVDLESYASVLEFSKRVCEQLPRLDGFVANAGIETKHFGTAEGLEKTLTINVVSTYLMALEVLPKLKETAEKAEDSQPVLSIIGSMIHVFGPESQLHSGLAGDLFASLSDVRTADMAARYPLSKMIVHLCFRELAEKVELADQGKKGLSRRVVNLVNPGWCASELHRYNGEPVWERIMAVIFRRTAEEGGRTLVHGVTAGINTHGQYLSECLIKPQSAYMRSEQAQKDQQAVWKQLMQTLEKIRPGISAGYV